MSEKVKNEIIDVLKVKINPEIPFVANFFDEEGKVDIGLMEKWCSANGYNYQSTKLKGRNFTHNVNRITIQDPNGKSVADMFNKKAKYKDDVAEVVVSRIAEKVGVKAVNTYMAKNPTGSHGTIADNGIPEGCKFIEISQLIPGGFDGENSLRNVFESIKNLKQGPLGISDENLKIDPQIYMDFMKLAIFDFCTGQSDRNVFNYGIIYDEKTHTVSLGAVWDNGNSFGMDERATYYNVTLLKDGLVSTLSYGCGIDAVAQGITEIDANNFMHSSKIIPQFLSPEFCEMVREYKLDMRGLIDFTNQLNQVSIEELNEEASAVGNYVLSEEETAIVNNVISDRSSKLSNVLTSVATQNELFNLSQGEGQGDTE